MKSNRALTFIGVIGTLALLSADSLAAPVKIKVQKHTNYEENIVAYYANITIGTPGQPANVLLDAGSPYFWAVSSDCQSDDCAGHNKYDHTKSSTYIANGTQYSWHYGAGDVTGVWSKDNIALLGTGPENVTLSQVDLGESSSVPKHFDPNMDGIIGLMTRDDLLGAGSPPGVIQQLYDQKIIAHRNFAFSPGLWLLGEDDASLYSGDLDFHTCNATNAHWRFESFGFGGSDLISTSVDTGAPTIHGSSDALGDLVDSIQAKVSDTEKLKDCDGGVISALPTVTFFIGNQSFPLTADQYIINDATRGCFIGITVNRGDTDESVGSSPGPGPADLTLGDVFVNAYYTSFHTDDAGSRSIAFAPLRS